MWPVHVLSCVLPGWSAAPATERRVVHLLRLVNALHWTARGPR